jgi:hypothetical protein
MDHHEGEVIRIALLAGDEAVVCDREFVDCDVKGPAMVFIGNGVRMDSNRFPDGDAVLLELDPAQHPRIVGAILLERVSFVGCTFTNVGIIGPKSTIDLFRTQD